MEQHLHHGDASAEAAAPTYIDALLAAALAAHQAGQLDQAARSTMKR